MFTSLAQCAKVPFLLSVDEGGWEEVKVYWKRNWVAESSHAHIHLQYVMFLIDLPSLSSTCRTHRGVGGDKSVFPSEPDFVHTHCFLGGKDQRVYWIEFNKRGCVKVKLCVLSAFPLNRDTNCVMICPNKRNVFPHQTTSNPLLGLTEEAPSLICEKPRWDIQLRTA